MRLINTRTLKLQQFIGRAPPYAILSHTWGKEEVSYRDFHIPEIRENKSGFSKIKGVCRESQRHGLEYAWVDTCCIDKSSSAELSEAINSMFKWYQNSVVCYAYLEEIGSQDRNQAPLGIGFGQSRWFTRGWTLQELIAPQRVNFYDRFWNKIGEKSRIASELQAITGIDHLVLEGLPLQHINVGRRMSWAAHRRTSREEDMAYCMLGIFGVKMPLLYGEGSAAFLRLQEEILRRSDDHTLFAWRTHLPDAQHPVRGLFASSPREFSNFLDKAYQPRPPENSSPKDNLVRVWDANSPQSPITISNKGIQIKAQIQDLRLSAPLDSIIVALNCCFGGDPARAVGIYLVRQGEDRYARIRANELADIPPEGELIEIHGLRSTMDVRGHRYDEPWVTSYKVRMERSARNKKGAIASARQRYEHAFYMDCNSFKVFSPLAEYSICGIYVVDSHTTLRCFRFSQNDDALDFILKTHDEFKGGLLFRDGSGSDFVLILLGAKISGAVSHHWFDIIQLAKEDLKHDSELVSRSIFGIRRRDKMPRKKKVRVAYGLELEVKTKPVVVEGIRMQRIEVIWSGHVLFFLSLLPLPIILWIILIYQLQ